MLPRTTLEGRIHGSCTIAIALGRFFDGYEIGLAGLGLLGGLVGYGLHALLLGKLIGGELGGLAFLEELKLLPKILNARVGRNVDRTLGEKDVLRCSHLAIKAIILTLSCTNSGTLEGATAEETLAEGVCEGTAGSTSAKGNGGIDLTSDRTSGDSNLATELDDAIAAVGLECVVVHDEDQNVLGLGTKHETKAHACEAYGRGRGPGAIVGTGHNNTGADIAREAKSSLDDTQQNNALALLEEVTGDAVGFGIKGGVQDVVGVPDHALHGGSNEFVRVVRVE